MAYCEIPSLVVAFLSSKDTFVKVWDLETQHCFLTLVEHRNEVLWIGDRLTCW